MRLIPDNIEHFNSLGEKILYLKFKSENSQPECFVLHSVFTNFHFKNISGELDFLVLAPGHGIFAIEVKHGGVSRKNGTWHFTNKLGAVTKKTTSPFAQVNGTMNSIRTFMLDKIRSDKKNYNRLSKILWGSGVAFTSMNDQSVDFGQEAQPWQIMTRRGLELPAFAFIEALSKGCHNQNKDKIWYDVNGARPTVDDCLKIIQILRGDFNVDYSGINKIMDNEYLIEEFTKEQFGLLDFIEYNPRCLIEGSAGTGKTIMALEIFRRKVAKSEKAALFCFNRKLGKKLGESAEKLGSNLNGQFYVGSLHAYLVEQTGKSPEADEDINKFFNETLPFEFLLQNESIDEKDKFNFLVIDEAQDLISPYFLEVYNSILKGGIKEGKWVFLGDFSNQAIYMNTPAESIRLLSESATYTRFPPLQINCRNTRTIALQNTLVTGILKPVFRSGSIEGEPIVVKFPVSGRQVEEIEAIIDGLVSDGIPLGKVTLLSPQAFEKSILINSQKITEMIKNGLEFSTIHSYKGLENSIIILFGFREIESDETKKLLYIGISRAKQRLYIVLDKSLESNYQRIISENFPKIR
ncbi:MAG: NERD domain-containing protein [Bacteroidota bacterium]